MPAAKSSKISVAVTGDARQFRQELDKAGKDVGKFSKGAEKAFSALKTAGIGLAVGLGTAFVKAGLDFEAMRGILIRGTGATGEALDDLQKQTEDVLKSVPDAAEEVAAAIADVNTFFGVTGDQLEGTTRLFLDFARVAGVDTADAIGAVDAILTQFGLTVEDVDELLGDLVRIAQATGVPMTKLLTQIEKFGPVFATVGFTAEETIAVFGQLERAGVDVARLGPALSRFFAEAAEAGEEPRAAFEAFVEQILNAESETQALALAAEHFTDQAARMVSAVRTGNLDLEDFGGLLGEGTGLVSEQAEAIKTLSERFAELKNKLLVELGPTAVKVMDWIIDATDKAIIVIQLLSKVYGDLENQLKGIFTAGVTAGRDFIDGLEEGFKSAVDWTANVAREIANGLVHIVNTEVIDRLNSALEFTIPLPFGRSWTIDPPDIPNIPMLAQGGIVTGPTLAVVGEAGPEAVIPLDRMGGMAGTTIINVNVTGVSGAEVVDAIRRETQRRGAAVFPTVTTRRT